MRLAVPASYHDSSSSTSSNRMMMTDSAPSEMERRIFPSPYGTSAADNLLPDMELGHSVTGSMGHSGHLSRPGHRVTGSSF